MSLEIPCNLFIVPVYLIESECPDELVRIKYAVDVSVLVLSFVGRKK